MNKKAIVLAAGCVCAVVSSAAFDRATAKDKLPPPHLEGEQRATGCEYLGKGYVKAPGSDTCIKVDGYSRTEGAVIFGR